MTLCYQNIFLVIKIGIFIQNLSEKYKKLSKLLNCCKLKTPIWATQNKQRVLMRPAGHQFGMPALYFPTLLHSIISVEKVST